MAEGVRLAHPELLEIIGEDKTIYYGADQDWYRTVWQQKAGCGPTAASVQLSYLARARGIPALYEFPDARRETFVDYMEDVWKCVTPGVRGLNKVSMYTDGVERFAALRGVAVRTHALEVPARPGRPDLSDCRAFVEEGLRRDCPVAFLNLHNGEETRLDKWHWVLITGLEQRPGELACTLADSGNKLEIDLALWHRTARDLGGFVYVTTWKQASM